MRWPQPKELAWAVRQMEAEFRNWETSVYAPASLKPRELVDPEIVGWWSEVREKGPWIQTFSGLCYPLLAPDASDVCLDDIAHAVAGLERYTGHARRVAGLHGYTVAQHSVHVSEIVPREDAFAALMHDSPEAYVGDASSPLKRCLSNFGYVERLSYLAIAKRFRLPFQLPPSVKHADLVLLATEKRDLMAPEPRPWLPLPEPLPERIRIWSADVAEERFRERFEELSNHP